MSTDLNAIVVMEFMGVISFIVSFLFFRQRQKINEKKEAFMDALNRRLISERGDGKCFSSEWVMDNVVYRPKKLFSTTPILITVFVVIIALYFFWIGPLILYNILTFGYASIVALVGISVILWTDAFQAYSYTREISKVPTEELDTEDRSYIELAKESLDKAVLRFIALGMAFSILGPFIPQIFNYTVSLLVSYSAIYFQMSEASFQTLSFLGAAMIFLLLGLMFVLPVVLWRVLLNKGRSLSRRMKRRDKG